MIAEQVWEVSLPATLGDTRIEYQMTATMGDFSNTMPWLSMGTSEPYFDGTSLGANFTINILRINHTFIHDISPILVLSQRCEKDY